MNQFFSHRHSLHMILYRPFFLVVILLLITEKMQGQFFDETYASLSDFRSLGVGAAYQDFQPRAGNTQADSAKIRFRAPLWSAEYRQMDIRVALGYSSYKFNNDSRSEINFSAESVTDISFSRDRGQGSFFLPVIFSTSFVQASGATNSAKDFNIANIWLGTGLKYKHISESFGVQLTGVGLLYYSTAGFSVQSGSSTAIIAEIQFLFREIIGDGITAGYRFEIQNWTMTDKTLNYSREFQGPFVGIFF